MPDSWMWFLRRKTKHVYSSLFLFVHDTHQNSISIKRRMQCRDMYWDSYSFHPSACKQNCIKTWIKITACVCIWKPSKWGWYWWWFLSVALHICISWNFSVNNLFPACFCHSGIAADLLWYTSSCCFISASHYPPDMHGLPAGPALWLLPSLLQRYWASFI